MFRAFFQFVLAILVASAVASETAVAEKAAKSARTQRLIEYYRSLPPAKRKVFLERMRARRRSLASTGRNGGYSSMRAQRSAPAGQKDVELRLNLLAGMSFLNGSESDDKQELAVQSDTSLNLAFAADASFYKYLGVELDAQLGLPSSQESQAGNDALFTQIRHRKASAAMLNLNGRLPIRTGSSVWIPKAGVGYGALFITDTTEFVTDSDGSSDSTTTTLSGGYWTVGLDARLGEKFRLGLDYARAVTPSVKSYFSADDSENRFTDGAFDRIRLGLSYRIAERISIGAQYIRRSTRFVMPLPDLGGTLPYNVSIDQNHVMALFGFEL